MNNTLKVISYNCKGLTVSKVPCIKELLLQCDVLLLEETWLFSNQFNVISKHFQECESVNICGMNEDIYCQGRPYGGCSIVYSNTLKVEPIYFENEKRVYYLLFVDKECLYFCCNHVVSNVDFAFFSSTGTQTLIYHFIITSNMSQCITMYDTLDIIDNISDHMPVLLVLSGLSPLDTENADNVVSVVSLGCRHSRRF